MMLIGMFAGVAARAEDGLHTGTAHKGAQRRHVLHATVKLSATSVSPPDLAQLITCPCSCALLRHVVPLRHPPVAAGNTADRPGLALPQGLPFCMAGVGDLLALFRCISCRYGFGTDASCPELLGAPGRVFTTGTVSMPAFCVQSLREPAA